MNVNQKVDILSCFVLLALYFFCSSAVCQTNETTASGAKKYDEIIDLNSLESIKVKKEDEIPKDELQLLLPKLDKTLYGNWSVQGDAKIWNSEESPPLLSLPKEFLDELQIEKVLKQTYQNENHSASVLIYKFKNFTGAYSAYTILHKGAAAKLKIGKNASESEKSVNFWKGNYFVDFYTEADNDNATKGFIILASQEISNNIKIEQLPPVVAIQLPALNRVHGSERYCLGPVCAKMFFTQYISDFDPAQFNFPESGGIITAQYQPPDAPSDKEKEEKVCLVLARYLSKEASESVFNNLKNCFDKKKSENKDIDIDIDDDLVKVKNKKNNFTIFKQRGNLLAIAYNITNKKSGEEFLNLVPWPIEITKPTGSQVPNSMNTLPKPGNEDNVTDKL